LRSKSATDKQNTHSQTNKIMAKPIKETPVLTGKDAVRFAYAVAHPRPVSREEVLRAQAVFNRLQACSELR